jgi:hypothetical protein
MICTISSARSQISIFIVLQVLQLEILMIGLNDEHMTPPPGKVEQLWLSAVFAEGIGVGEGPVAVASGAGVMVGS